ncbi:MAG: hypothetical protein IKN61_08775 [Bacteroidaceae bacterium]|nr:hypothetical protein [Bacteroidaceae bacterium]
MTPKTTLKRVFGAFLLMILVCIPQSAGASNTAAELRGDTVSISGNLNFNNIFKSAQNLLDGLSGKIADDTDLADLNLKFDFDFDLKSSQPFLLIQVIYNTLAGEDGMVNQLKDKEIKRFDEKTLNKLKRQFTKRSNKEIKKLCKGDRQTQKDLKRKIKKLLDGIQIKQQ